MDRNSFHLAHPAATGAFHPGLTVPDEFHEASRGANHSVAPKSAATEPAYRQYRAARWFLLPEVGLRTRRQVLSGSLNGNRQTVKFFMCATYSENGLAGP